jgi:hypothetical protein
MAAAAAQDGGKVVVPVDLELGCRNQLAYHDHGFEATQEREEEQVETYRSKQEPVAELRRLGGRPWRKRARARAGVEERACGRGQEDRKEIAELLTRRCGERWSDDDEFWRRVELGRRRWRFGKPTKRQRRGLK